MWSIVRKLCEIHNINYIANLTVIEHGNLFNCYQIIFIFDKIQLHEEMQLVQKKLYFHVSVFSGASALRYGAK